MGGGGAGRMGEGGGEEIKSFMRYMKDPLPYKGPMAEN